MSYIDKKNEWWRIDNADADIIVKAKEIFHMFASKYPTVVVEGRKASFTSKEVTIHLVIKACVGVNGRVLLRYSTDENDLRAKSLQSCVGMKGEVREGHKYSDGSSRINLDYAFNEINSIIERKAKFLDNAKKAKFIKQVEQMKIVGRIKMCINDEKFVVEPCQYNYDKAKILNIHKNKKEILSLTRYESTKSYYAYIENVGSLVIKDEDLENFIKDSEGFLKYV